MPERDDSDFILLKMEDCHVAVWELFILQW